MANSPQEIARRKQVMAEARRQADQMFDEITEEHQTKVANAIHQSIAEAGPSVSIGDAQKMLAKFDEER